MRVYEAAKLLNISNKELLDLLAKNGFKIKSHMSSLSDDALAFVEHAIKKATKSTPAQKVKEKKAHVKPKVSAKKEVEEKPKEKIEVVEEVVKEVSLEPEVEPEKPEVDKIEPVELKEVVLEPMTVAQLAEKIEKPVSEIILTLLKKGVVSPKNQLLNERTVEDVLSAFGYIAKKAPSALKKEERVAVSKGEHERLPVVVVLGHVDHGKTTLLDFIRETRIAEREKGGITQHLGAYEATTPQGNIVFLDTPGHEAFSNIRGRGVSVADLAILVVAADDSVMPQTIEAIKKIKRTGIPVIVAINKIDRIDPSRIEVVKSDLARYEILPEEWGGDVVCIPISAKTGKGIDKLLEMIVLQGQLMDLRTNKSKPAVGFILESKLEKGLGAVATLICQEGTLRVGDLFSAGHAIGRVVSIVDSYGKRLKEVGPSLPVQVSGFSELPHAGDHFEVIGKEKYEALKSSHGLVSAPMPKKSTDQAMNMIIKCDSSSTKEALIESLERIFEKAKKQLNIIYSGVGNVSESDIVLASDTGSQVYGLHVKLEPTAEREAKKNLVRVHLFGIIYKLLEHIQNILEQPEAPKMVSKKIGEAIVRKVFPIKNVGVIAGSYVKEGRISREGHIIAWRGRKKIGEGSIKSLERDRNPVKEVHTGFECAFLVSGIEDWEVDDRVECYLEVSEK